MAWFAWQSALFILLGFALGVLVGYWFWRIQWRRVAFTESEAVTVIARRHERELSDKDAEIGRLQSLLAGGTGVVASAADDADDADDAATTDADTDVAADVAADVDMSVDTSVDATDDASAGEAAADATADEDDAALLADIDMTTVGEAADAADAEGADSERTDTDGAAEPVTVVELPAADDVPAGTVVDVTDEALAAQEDDADRGAVAHALAQLPTQSTGDDGVVDLAAAEQGAPDDADPAGTDDMAAAQAGDGADAPVAAPVPLADLTAAEADDEVVDDGSEDDLERIEGIGPRIASALRTAGIRSFRRLADADVPTLQAALENAGLRFAPSLPTWSRQARFLADGDEVGFIKLTESLVAGREPGRSR